MPQDKISYEDWNEVISAYFYNMHAADKPVYLQLDPDILTQIGQLLGITSEQATTSFIYAVRSRLRQNGPQNDQFNNFIRNTRIWETLHVHRDPQNPPPFLALLGLCVLAASKMNADDEVSAANYYVHLNELLGFGRKRGRPRGFDQLDDFWGKLQWWLNDVLKGEFGYSTANNHYGGVYIGYPISQCLLRRTDREKLSDFFRWAGIDPRDESLENDDFLPMLQEWASKTTCTFSQHGRRIFERNNQELISQIAKFTFAEYQLWDGGSLDSTGGRSSDIKLQLEFSRRRFECTLYARALSAFPDGNYQNFDHEPVYLQRASSNANWFNPLDEKFLTDILDRKPLVLRQNSFKLQIKPQSVIPFRNDIDSGLGGWVSCAKVGLGEKHFVLCHQDVKAKVEEYLHTYAESGWRLISSRQEIFQNKGWVCFSNVRVMKQISHDLENDLACLVPPLRVGIKLSGGLKVKRGIWLKNGEPEVVISIESNQQTPVYVDKQQVAVISEKSAIIQLSRLNLTIGQHEIRVGKRRRSFAICDSGSHLITKQAETTLGHLIQRNKDIFTTKLISPQLIPKELPANYLHISGASIVGADDDVVFPIEKLLILPYGGRRYIILGRRYGEAVEIHQVADIPLWAAAKAGYLHGHKITISFEPQWIIRIKGSQKILLPVGSPQSPLDSIFEGDKLSLWKQWANKVSLKRKLDKKHHSMWQQYNQAAKRL